MTVDPDTFEATMRGAAPPDGPETALREWSDLDAKLTAAPEADKGRLRVQVAAARERVRSLLSGQAAPAARPLWDFAVPLTGAALAADPPPQPRSLETIDGAPVLLRGQTVILGSPGGTGKTIVECELAVAAALGRPWVGEGSWRATPGRGLLLVAEEARAGMLRRLHWACVAAGLSTAEMDEVARNVTVLPLAGVGCALTTGIDPATGELPMTDRAREILDRLRAAAAEGKPYTLVIVDPLTHFAGADTEKDNIAGARFVQLACAFAAEDCGCPTVWIAHHTRKLARGDDPESVEALRGGSALANAARAVLIMRELRHVEGAPSLLRLVLAKRNDVPPTAPLVLCRPQGDHGCLRLARAEEIAAYEARAKDSRGKLTRDDRIGRLGPEILAALAEKPRTGAALAAKLGARREDVSAACATLAEEGEIVRTKGQHSPWGLAGGVTDQSDRTPGRSDSTPDCQSDRPSPPSRGRSVGHSAEDPPTSSARVVDLSLPGIAELRAEPARRPRGRRKRS